MPAHEILIVIKAVNLNELLHDLAVDQCRVLFPRYKSWNVRQSERVAYVTISWARALAAINLVLARGRSVPNRYRLVNLGSDALL